MKLLCEELVDDEHCGLSIRYGFCETVEDDKPVYALRTELFENGILKGKAEERIGSVLSRAIKLYGLAIKTKATPIDLKYVIEDFD